MTAKQKPPTNIILNLFLVCSWIKKPVGNQEGCIPLPQSMLSFHHPCYGQAMSEGPGHTPSQVKREQITLLVRKKFLGLSLTLEDAEHGPTAVCGERKNTLKRTLRFSLYKLQKQAKLSYGAGVLGEG